MGNDTECDKDQERGVCAGGARGEGLTWSGGEWWRKASLNLKEKQEELVKRVETKCLGMGKSVAARMKGETQGWLPETGQGTTKVNTTKSVLPSAVVDLVEKDWEAGSLGVTVAAL